MSIKEALMKFCIFDPMTIRDLSGKTREEIIQVDLLALSEEVEEALNYILTDIEKAAGLEGVEQYVHDRWISIFAMRLAKTSN